MPELIPEKRAMGSRVWTQASDNPHPPGELCDCDWSDPANWNHRAMRHRVLPMPDQSRYGHSKTDPPRYNANATIRRTK